MSEYDNMGMPFYGYLVIPGSPHCETGLLIRACQSKYWLDS